VDAIARENAWQPIVHVLHPIASAILISAKGVVPAQMLQTNRQQSNLVGTTKSGCAATYIFL
jgi:hypothetical protein